MCEGVTKPPSYLLLPYLPFKRELNLFLPPLLGAIFDKKFHNLLHLEFRGVE
jgi:hypothetical protein